MVMADPQALVNPMIRMIFLLCGLAVLSTGQAGEDEANWLKSSDYEELLRWMVDQPDTEMRAAGLSALARSGDSGPTIEPTQFMAEVESLLQDNPTAAAVSMIARGCHQLDLVDACAEAGVLDAINRLDGGNPLAAAHLHDADSPAFRQMLISAKRIDDHYAEEVTAWFEAFIANKTGDMGEGGQLRLAMAFTMASVTPLDRLTTRCRAAVATDDALDRACRRLSEWMRDSTHTLILRNVGYGMAAARARAMGLDERADALQKEKEAQFARQMCLVQAAEPALIDAEDGLGKRWLEVFTEQGELAASALVAGEAADECPEA